MKKSVCLILFFLSLSICFGLNPRPLHISEIFESVDEKIEQIQVFKSGSYEYYGELIEGEDILLSHTVFDWKNLKTYTIEYISGGTEIKEYRERTFNKDLLLVQDIWVDYYGELILDYEYAPDYSSFKCYATEDDEKYLNDEYYIKKTSTGYNGFYRNYRPDGDIYAASKYTDPLPYFYDKSKKEVVSEIYCMKYDIETVTEIEYYDSNSIDTIYDYIFSEKSYVIIDNDYDDKYEYFFDDDYNIIREIDYYAIDDPDIYYDTRYILEKDSTGRIISEKYYEDVSETNNFNPDAYFPDKTLIMKYPKTGLKSLERPTEFCDYYNYYGDEEGYYCEDCDEYHYWDDYYYDDEEAYYCDGCNEYHYSEDECLDDEEKFYCDGCGEYHYYDEYYYCEDCDEYHYYEDYYYCEDCDEYHYYNDYYYDGEGYYCKGCGEYSNEI